MVEHNQMNPLIDIYLKLLLDIRHSSYQHHSDTKTMGSNPCFFFFYIVYIW